MWTGWTGWVMDGFRCRLGHVWAHLGDKIFFRLRPLLPSLHWRLLEGSVRDRGSNPHRPGAPLHPWPPGHLPVHGDGDLGEQQKMKKGSEEDWGEEQQMSGWLSCSPSSPLTSPCPACLPSSSSSIPDAARAGRMWLYLQIGPCQTGTAWARARLNPSQPGHSPSWVAQRVVPCCLTSWRSGPGTAHNLLNRLCRAGLKAE
jgi:hypothetical protein